MASYYPHTQQGALHSFGYIFAGTIEIFPKDQDLSKVESLLGEFISSIQSHILESLDTELADSLVESLKTIVDMLIERQEEGLDVSIWYNHNKAVFYMLIKSLGVYNNFRLVNKPDPEHTVS